MVVKMLILHTGKICCCEEEAMGLLLVRIFDCQIIFEYSLFYYLLIFQIG